MRGNIENSTLTERNTVLEQQIHGQMPDLGGLSTNTFDAKGSIAASTVSVKPNRGSKRKRQLVDDQLPPQHDATEWEHQAKEALTSNGGE